MVLVLLLAASQGARAQNISTVAGNGDTGFSDGVAATAAPLNRPLDVALASDGDLLIADYGDGTIPGGHHRIRRVDFETGVITTVAGDGTADNTGDNGPATAARLNSPISVAVNTATGDVYIADYYNNRVRRVRADNGWIENFAGSASGDFGYSGDGVAATAAVLGRPAGLAIDSAGNVFIADQGNHVIRRVDAVTGYITTVAGRPEQGGWDGDGDATGPNAVRLNSPYGLTFDPGDGTLVFCDTANWIVRRLVGGMIVTIAGDRGTVTGDEEPAINASLGQPRDVAFDNAGNLYIVDWNPARVWRVDAVTDWISTVVGTGIAGFSGDEPPATDSRLDRPNGLTVSASGDLYIADTYNYRIRRVVDLQDLDDDDDNDTVIDVNDNCSSTANLAQSDFDMDGVGDLCDACETMIDLELDSDVDGVDNACDTCLNQWNPPLAGAPTANRTFVSHQRDDDADGRGNRCDFDYNNAGPVLLSGDFNDMKWSLLPSPGLMTTSTCGATVGNPPTGEGGSGADQRCGEFDHDGAGPTVTTMDFNLCKAAFQAGGVINTNFPKCAACSVGIGWSNTIGTGGERLNRPVCQSAVGGACAYAP